MFKYLTLFCAILLVSLTAAQDERKCVNGKQYFDGCNDCFCGNGHVLCTLKACFDSTGQAVPVQQPSEDFWEQ
ncbi:serine protease inhibitor 3-like [Fopius arisanus]|uniref:Serine protease inhibitor 3-like n=1 Tax=Fopius arisanus TaxID=64838 RepID=A0A9R1TSZ4_9HYME|nr:PREDICTED: serine protease inhibitor 3-like [Fopius arisanus]